MKRVLLILLITTFNEFAFSQQWFPLEGGLSGLNAQSDKVTALCTDSVHHVLFVAGSFQYANDTLLVKNIAKWDGSQWSSLITHDSNGIYNGFSGPVLISALTIFHNRLFIALNSSLGNVMVSCSVDSFDVAILGVFNEEINAISVYNDSLYIGGAFTQWKTYYTSSTWYNASGILKWNGGAQWQQVGGGITVGGFSGVNAMCVHHNKLYAAGIFETAGGTYCKNIACWNDTSWSAVGSGFGFSGQYDCILYSLASYKNKLFLGGTFHQSDGYISTGLAYWNDTIYKPGGVSADLIHAMKEFNGKLYIGGWEAGLGISPNDRVTCYNDTTWSATGLGPENPVYAMEVFDSSLYVGGEFLHVDSVTFVGYITRFDTALIQDTTGIIEVKQNEGEINVYPNPANETVTITANNIKEIVVSNLLGEVVQSLKFKVQSSSATIDISKLPQGIYLLRVQTNNGWRVGKVLKE